MSALIPIIKKILEKYVSSFKSRLKHIFIKGSIESEDYSSPKQAPHPKFPERIRAIHANKLLEQIKTLNQYILKIQKQQPSIEKSQSGIYVEFESKSGFPLKTQSLDLPSKGIELLSVRKIQENEEEKTVAQVFIPLNKISEFTKKIEQYRDRETKSGKPKNSDLVNSIENINLSAIRSLWTDLDEFFPQPDENIWWEVWLRATEKTISQFTNFARNQNIAISKRIQTFPDRYVLLAYTSAQCLSTSIESLDFIAELRRAKETTADFLDMPHREQSLWVESLKGLITPPNPISSPVVCILDTGINRYHPLISDFLPEGKQLTCNPDWNVHDDHGHGTQMAGLALYGDLTSALLSTNKILVPCNIESVKILHPIEKHDPDLYGSVTEDAVIQATAIAPNRNRILCMAVTAKDFRDKGQPSSWSAAIDNICIGKNIEGKSHLFILSAGNADPSFYVDYPSANYTDQIHDPGQSWNALTIGAFTNRVDITEPSFRDWTPLAQAGDIAPATTTSLIWKKTNWPIKPDVVFEGGNAALNQEQGEIDLPESLSLLTTNYKSNIYAPSFASISDTSAAAAQAANMAAILSHEYPEFWPETLRALLVHSAEWTPKMMSIYPIKTRINKEHLLRICGYGVPDLNRALWSANNHLTLVAQEQLKPFEGRAMKHLNIHNIPWPSQTLLDLGEAEVKMRVTLSYFIEPNPARRGWEHKFRYQSHGLRFDVKTPTESKTEFLTRLNRKRWDEEKRDSVTSTGDSSRWFLGEQIRSKGSIHSDVWIGTAAELAERGMIAVYPVVGWWREKHTQGHTEKMARYSLIVSISTDSVEVDLYTPIETQIITTIET